MKGVVKNIAKSFKKWNLSKVPHKQSLLAH